MASALVILVLTTILAILLSEMPILKTNVSFSFQKDFLTQLEHTVDDEKQSVTQC